MLFNLFSPTCQACSKEGLTVTTSYTSKNPVQSPYCLDASNLPLANLKHQGNRGTEQLLISGLVVEAIAKLKKVVFWIFFAR